MFCSYLEYDALFIRSEVLQHTLRQAMLYGIHEGEQMFLKFLAKSFVHVLKFILTLEKFINVAPKFIYCVAEVRPSCRMLTYGILHANCGVLLFHDAML